MVSGISMVNDCRHYPPFHHHRVVHLLLSCCPFFSSSSGGPSLIFLLLPSLRLDFNRYYHWAHKSSDEVVNIQIANSQNLHLNQLTSDHSNIFEYNPSDLPWSGLDHQCSEELQERDIHYYYYIRIRMPSSYSTSTLRSSLLRCAWRVKELWSQVCRQEGTRRMGHTCRRPQA